MTISSTSGLYLPIVFAIGMGLSVILFTYLLLLVFAAHQVSGVFNKITKVERVLRYVAGGVFVLAGVYYVSIFAGLL